MADVDTAVTEMLHKIMAVGDDTRRFTQQESVDFYSAVAAECNDRAQTIFAEME